MDETIKIAKTPDNRIKVTFPYNAESIARLKNIIGHQWHPDEEYWSFPNQPEILAKISAAFNSEKIKIDPDLRQDSDILKDLNRELVSHKYSCKTIKSYLHYNRQLLNFLKKMPSQIIQEDVKDFIYYLAEKKGISVSSLNIAINALKFYYGEVFFTFRERNWIP